MPDLESSVSTHSKQTRKRNSDGPPKRKKQKLSRLPDNATISKRPIYHPSIPTPFASSSAPKVLYIKPSSPFIPAIKRVRSLLSEVRKRSEQSSQAVSKLKPNGRLDNKAIERAIAESSSGGAAAAQQGYRGRIQEEEVFIKATGRAIPRALSIGNYFQAQIDCSVRVELGSVMAIDDIELDSNEASGGNGAAKDDKGDANMAEIHAQGAAKGGQGRPKKSIAADEVPETRIRNLSAVTIAITLKS